MKLVRRQVSVAFRQLKNQDDDIHNRLMSAYHDLPDWMYLLWFLVFICI